MACYRIEWKKSAVKELQKLAKQIIPDTEAVHALAVDPFPHGSKKIRGALHTYRVRKGEYRIIYSVEHELLIVQVIRIGHCKESYQKFHP